MINIIRNASPVIIMIVLIMILCFVTQSCHGQFDFEKEVAGLFDFGKIPEEFSQQPKLITHPRGKFLTACPVACLLQFIHSDRCKCAADIAPNNPCRVHKYM